MVWVRTLSQKQESKLEKALTAAMYIKDAKAESQNPLLLMENTELRKTKDNVNRAHSHYCDLGIKTSHSHLHRQWNKYRRSWRINGFSKKRADRRKAIKHGQTAF